jgi:hypothetical protein
MALFAEAWMVRNGWAELPSDASSPFVATWISRADKGARRRRKMAAIIGHAFMMGCGALEHLISNGGVACF